MLLRYSQHLAAGHGIVWNIGEPPVDGATDFLFMLLVAGLQAVGLSLEAAAQILGLCAHGATAALVYLGGRRLHGAPPPLALVPAAFLAFGPGLNHLAACYGTPLFALFAVPGLLGGDPSRPGRDERRARGEPASSPWLPLRWDWPGPRASSWACFFLGAILVYRRGEAARPLLGRFAPRLPHPRPGLLPLALVLLRPSPPESVLQEGRRHPAPPFAVDVHPQTCGSCRCPSRSCSSRVSSPGPLGAWRSLRSSPPSPSWSSWCSSRTRPTTSMRFR